MQSMRELEAVAEVSLKRSYGSEIQSNGPQVSESQTGLRYLPGTCPANARPCAQSLL